MKSLLKSLVAASALVAATSQASLTTISFVNSSEVAVNAAHNAFILSLHGPMITETFDTLGTAPIYNPLPFPSTKFNEDTSWENASASFSTKVGTFTLTTPGQGGALNSNNTQLTIESRKTGESGRETLAGSPERVHPTDFWLDSNDAKQVVWSFNSPLVGNFNALGFYISDSNDSGGILSLTLSNGATTTVSIPDHQKNGNLGYVSVYSTLNIVGGTFQFNNNSGGDGWGIDDVVVGNVPEPGALLLMGLGLLGLGAARRRTHA